ncbi:MAG: pyridoxamine 5'-phosphate oxidase family protein [Thermoleophilia bacterium]|nr:pyridoxamine 5'-phosphate oxidase family protein [Thermoleophilia bacterium]
MSYDDLQQEIVQELQKHKVGVLATAEGNSVTARSMSLIFDGLTSSCFTNAHSRKARQIAANERSNSLTVSTGRHCFDDPP